MQQTLMQQGIELMLYGMGTVFIFLTLLVLLTSVMSSLIQRFIKPELPVDANRVTTAPVTQSDNQLIAVITAAIRQHRNR
jgi:oxaloacetate decarboxylase gamma subunit